jgi:hypothetical protein
MASYNLGVGQRSQLSVLIITHKLIIPDDAQHLNYRKPYWERNSRIVVRHSRGAVKLTYELGVPLIDESLGGIPRGTSLLIKGSSFAGKDKILDEAVSEGFEDGEGTVYVTTNDPGSEVLDEYPEKNRFGVVDCVSKEQGVEDTNETEEKTVVYADSPSDMTGIGG